MIKIIATEELAEKYTGIVSIMRKLPQDDKVELYMGQSIFKRIKDNEDPQQYEVVYDSSLNI